MKKKLDFEFLKVQKEDEEAVINLITKCFPSLDKTSIVNDYRYINSENPEQGNNPIGIIVKHEKKIIGYRGLVGLPFLFGNEKKNIIVLYSGVIDPDYRRKGVFSRINKKVIEVFDNEYSFFLNTSSNRKSGPSYVKQKWKVLGDKDYLYKSYFKLKKSSNKNYTVIFKNIVPSKVICNLHQESIFSHELKIRLDLSSNQFVDWIFSKEGYKWAILEKDNLPITYCCYSIENKVCNLIHFDMKLNDKSLVYLLEEIAIKHSFKKIICFNKKIDSPRRKILRRSGFWGSNMIFIRKILKKQITPIFIMPTRKNHKLSRYTVNKIDASNIQNWDVTMLFNF